MADEVNVTGVKVGGGAPEKEDKSLIAILKE